ncbi:MAG TPA: glycine--tRNA ligase subunit beta [Steroidobacteraceae bacterium]|nr:glycine--tRNA ligase subunit beta [Steroidobacteraceae bacterium]
MSKRDLLVEIGTEELPPLALKGLADALLAGIVQRLDDAHVKHGRAQRFASPRRLAVLVKGVLEQQPEQQINRRGPPVSAAFDANGQPTRAALAFAESCGVQVAALQRVQDAKGEFLLFSARRPGAFTGELLPGVVQGSLDALPIPKRMRWGSGEAQFVRPVHWVVLLFGKDVVPASILGVQSDRFTRGHRFHAPKPFRISTPGAYLNALRKRAYVLADFEERRERIQVASQELARALGGQPVMDEALLDEVTSLVEWPVALAGRFEERFLHLPREVLIATLQDHQRYFPLSAANDVLMPRFIAVSNIESSDPDQVRAGNERVVGPRLADAAFFYETDRKLPLAARCPALAQVTFQTRLGTLQDKVARIRTLGAHIAGHINADARLTERAAELCKCDLLTAMVGEFPELQGTMGRYYAQHDGEPGDVAAAIAEHYLPRFAGDDLPATRVGMALALADKLDTITGIFAIDQKPTGTRDPFGVRRASLGVVRIIIEKQLELDLRELIAMAAQLLAAQSAGVGSVGDGVRDQVYDYMMERLRAYYLDNASGLEISTEMFDSVLSNRPASPLDFDARLRAVERFLKLDAAASLAAANKRIANILRKSQLPQTPAVNIELLRAPAEQRLHGELERLRPQIEPLLAQRNYTEALQQLAQLREPVDAFFDSVMVMDSDAQLRNNRLTLLAQLRDLFLHTADLSRLPG